VALYAPSFIVDAVVPEFPGIAVRRGGCPGFIIIVPW